MLKEANQPTQSHFIWQPLLLLTVSGYLLAEIYFLTVMVNTFDRGNRASDFSTLEIVGRLISGAGIGLSVLIGLSLNRKLNEAKTVRRVLLKLLIFATCTAIGYFAVKSLYQLMENHASKPIIHCSVVGNAAIRVFDRGELQDFESWSASSLPLRMTDRQLVRLYLPLHVCIDDKYRRALQSSEVILNELVVMVEETGLPKKVAAPAIDIYKGFRAQIHRFAGELMKLEMVKSEPQILFSAREEAIAKLKKLLESQSRYTKTDVEHILAIYACIVDKAILVEGVVSEENRYSAEEQRFMLSTTRCLYDWARSRFKTIAVPQRAIDIYTLEQAIALDWAKQFILSPHYIPEDALALMRHSFALVFLPTYAVLISTFVVFICFASYLRTRFLISASKTRKRVNPVINAVLSPLVVVPGIWTLIFVWVSEPRVEEALFPKHTQSGWVMAVKVTLRPLFYYYGYSYSGLTELHLPMFLSVSDNTEPAKTKKGGVSSDLAAEQAEGFYVGELCLSECQRVVVDLHPDSESYGSLRYSPSGCATKLVFDGIRSGRLNYFEIANDRQQCRHGSRWLVTILEGQIQVELRDGRNVSQALLQDLFI